MQSPRIASRTSASVSAPVVSVPFAASVSLPPTVTFFSTLGGLGAGFFFSLLSTASTACEGEEWCVCEAGERSETPTREGRTRPAQAVGGRFSPFKSSDSHASPLGSHRSWETSHKLPCMQQ